MANATILIVEDERPLLTALSKKIEKEGFAVLTAGNGEEGLAFALSKHPDLILLDIVMPRKDGLSMLHDLRKDAWGATVPVIMLTNLSDADKVSAALADGVFDFLLKIDWSLEEVIGKVHERLGQ